MPTLEVITGKAAGTTVDLSEGSGDLLLGTRRTAGLVVRDPWVSFSHALITRKGQAYVIVDKRSRSGTFVNGNKVGLDGMPLNDGDTIGLGKTEIRFRTTTGPLGPFGAPLESPGAPAAGTQPGSDGGTIESLRQAVAAREKLLAESQAHVRALTEETSVLKRMRNNAPPPPPPPPLPPVRSLPEVAKQAVEKARAEAVAAGQQIEELKMLNASLERRLSEARTAETRLEGDADVEELRDELESLRRQLKGAKESESRIGELEKALVAGRSGAVSRIQALESTISKLTKEKKELEKEHKKLKQGHDTNPASPVDDFHSQVKELENQLASAEEQRRGLQKKLQESDLGKANEAEQLSKVIAERDSLRRELEESRRESREEVLTLRKDLEDLNEDMLLAEERFRQQLAEVEARVGVEKEVSE